MRRSTHTVQRRALALLLMMLPAVAAAQTTFTVTVGGKTSANPYFNRGSTATYYIDGVEAKQLTLTKGVTYTFQMSDVPAFHPFYITTSDVGAGSGAYDVGVTGNNATGNSVLTFTPSQSAPPFLFYQCAAHDYMGWEIIIQESTSIVADESSARGPVSLVAAPNPASNSAIAMVTLAETRSVLVTVHDMLGRLVATLHDGVIEAGSRRFVVDAGSLAPGLYEIRASGEGISESTRLVVAR